MGMGLFTVVCGFFFMGRAYVYRLFLNVFCFTWGNVILIYFKLTEKFLV